MVVDVMATKLVTVNAKNTIRMSRLCSHFSMGKSEGKVEARLWRRVGAPGRGLGAEPQFAWGLGPFRSIGSAASSQEEIPGCPP